jgi:hypothetical protein
MSETKKALQEMQARLDAMAKQPSNALFRHLVDQGVIDAQGHVRSSSAEKQTPPAPKKR